MHKDLFHNAASGKLIVSDGIVVDCNQKGAEDLGYSDSASVLNLPISQISADGSSFDPEWFGHSEYPLRLWKIRRANGAHLDVYAEFSRTNFKENSYICIQWYRQNAWDKLEEQNTFQGAMLHEVIDADKNLIYSKNYCDGDGVYIGYNKAFKEFYGLREEEIMGKTDIEIFGEEQGKEFRKRDARIMESRQGDSCEEWVTLGNGNKRLLHTDKTILRDDNGGIIGLLSISRDITDEHQHIIELEESEQAYKELANTDPLTGIPNRRLFYELSQEHFKTTHNKKQSLSLIMIDVDNFKQINDTYGHLVGDKVLKHIVGLFQDRLRTDDLLARYAGDEFALLLPNTDVGAAQKIARILQSLLEETPYTTPHGETITVTISMGVSEHMDEKVCEELLQNADKALYSAKEMGRNIVEVFTASK